MISSAAPANSSALAGLRLTPIMSILLVPAASGSPSQSMRSSKMRSLTPQVDRGGAVAVASTFTAGVAGPPPARGEVHVSFGCHHDVKADLRGSPATGP